MSRPSSTQEQEPGTEPRSQTKAEGLWEASAQPRHTVVQIQTEVGGDTQDGQKPRDTVIKGRMSTRSSKTQKGHTTHGRCIPALKKQEIQIPATKWINLENVMLSERRQTWKDKCYMIPLLWGTWRRHVHRDRTTRGRVFVWDEILELESGSCYTTVGMYLMPLNVHLKWLNWQILSQ